MQHISVSPQDYFKENRPKRPPSHEKAAIVDEILKLAPATEKYGYGYWLRWVKRSGVSYPAMISILKNVKEAPAQFPRGALITNALKKLVKPNQQLPL